MSAVAMRRSTRARKLTQKGEEYHTPGAQRRANYRLVAAVKASLERSLKKEKLAAQRAAALFMAAFERSQDRNIAECKRALAEIAARRAEEEARRTEEAARRAWEEQKALDEPFVNEALDFWGCEFMLIRRDDDEEVKKAKKFGWEL